MTKIDRFLRDVGDQAAEAIGAFNRSGPQAVSSTPSSYVAAGTCTAKVKSTFADTTSRRRVLVTTAGLASAAGSLPFVLSANLGAADQWPIQQAVLTRKASPTTVEQERKRFISTFLEVVEYRDPETEFLVEPIKLVPDNDDVQRATADALPPTFRFNLFDDAPSDPLSKPVARFDLATTFDARNDDPTQAFEFSNGRLSEPNARLRVVSLDNEEISDDANLVETIVASAPPMPRPNQIRGEPTQPRNFVGAKVPTPRARGAVAAPEYIAQSSLTSSSFTPLNRPSVTTGSGLSDKSLLVRNIHTGDKIFARYQRDGQFDPGALDELKFVLRDRRDGTSRDMDPKLFDQMFDILAMNGVADGDSQINIVSGYRSPQTNAYLRSKSAGVARNSFHMQGRAIDMFVDNIDLSSVHVAALKLKRGGVGYYPGSNFIHLDTGPIRNWPARYHAFGQRIRNNA